MGELNVQSVLYICTLDMTDKASSKLLTWKAKEIVYNVSEHFRNEGKGFLERTAEATGVLLNKKTHTHKQTIYLNQKKNNGKM